MTEFFEKLKSYALAIVSVIAAILAFLFWYEREKEKTSETLLKNEDVKKEVNQLDAQIEKNNALIDASKEAVKDKEASETNQSILDDLNSRR